MHKILQVGVLFVSLLIVCPAMADTPPGFGLDGLADVVSYKAISSGPTINGDTSVFGVSQGGDQRLRTTLLGKLGPNGEPRLAVHWEGPKAILLDVWVDLDGNGAEGPEELVIEGRPIEPGIEVINLGIPAQLYRVAEPRLSVRALTSHPSGWHATLQKDVSGPDGVVCGWQPGFHVDGFDNYPRAFTVFDDGTGEALYAGGDFIGAGAVTANYIAKWDGTEWSALSGPSGTGVSGSVRALAVYNDGTGEALYVGGDFTTAGGVTANSIAKWNGTEWSALNGPSGTGMDDSVFALAVYDDGTGAVLYVGGAFITAGGVTVNRIARWDGTEWSAISLPAGTGVSNYVYCLAVYDDGTGTALYVGGLFGRAGGVDAHYIAKWDGLEWSALGAGLDGRVHALTVFNDGSGEALYVGGEFQHVLGGIYVSRIAKWDGSEWSPLDGSSNAGVGGDVYALSVFNDGNGEKLFAGGDFHQASVYEANNIAKWDGTEWYALSGPLGSGMNLFVLALAVYDDGTGEALYTGGWFTTAGGVNVDHIAKWRGTEWSAVGGQSGSGINSTVSYPRVSAAVMFDDGTGEALYAGGWFPIAGGVTVNNIAKWDGTEWSALSGPSGTGVSGSVRALAVYNDGTGEALYAGGSFVDAGGVTVNSIAKWDGTEWSALSGPSAVGVTGIVYALVVYDDGTGEALYVGGSMSSAGGVNLNKIAKWDGTGWDDIGYGSLSTVNALAVYDDGAGEALYVGAGSSLFQRWDGLAWSNLGGLDGPINTFAVYDDGMGEALWVGGEFTLAGGEIANRIARWDGTEWSPLSGPSGVGVDDQVNTLAVYDDGTGEGLYVGGNFITAGGVNVNQIAMWNGTTWSALSGPSGVGTEGIYHDVHVLAVYNDGIRNALYAGGDFTVAGGVASSRFAKWACFNVPPSDPTSLISTTHAISTWSVFNVVGIEWSGATDDTGSGLAGYSVLFDNSAATIPDSIVDVAHTSDPHSTNSESLVDGVAHWFHLRTCDGGNNCSDGMHLGPFWIDTTPPGMVGGLISTSHHIGVPLNDTRIDVSWTAAIDSLSGIDGYGVEFSSSPNWTCDEIQDTTGVMATSSALAEGQWWVHVCAVDAAGNWGGVASAGSYIIDTTSPVVLSLGSEGGTTDGVLVDGESALAAITQLMVEFSEPINPIGEGGGRDIADPGKYRLLDVGPDGVLNTSDCTGALAGDDTDILMTSAWAWTGHRVVSVQISVLSALPAGWYALMVCAVHDVAGNEMVGPWSREFAITATNHLEDPNFDHGWLGVWATVSPNPSDIRLLPMDPTSESSGIAVVETVSGAGEIYELSQCLDVVEGAIYGLGGIAMIASAEPDAPTFRATVRFYRNPGCTDLLEVSEAELAQGDSNWLWGPRLIHSVLAPIEALSAQVGFVVEGGTANEFSLYLDETVFFEGIGFIDGFETGDTNWWSESNP